MPEKYYLTTPLYYVNSKPHIGHSYTEIAADALARFQQLRLGKENVYFLTGTDEHGQKVDKAAQASGMTPRDFTDKMSGTFRDLWKTLHISYDDFIRTTEPRHVGAVQAVWKALHANGEIYKDTYRGLYCTPCESFWLESQVLRENGQVLCPDCKRPVETLEEENYFLKLSKHQAWLIETLEKGDAIKILPETRRNEVLGFLRNNTLQDLCISRPKSRLLWGIESPISPNHVTYVWFDALINYISAVGYGTDPAKMKEWWPAHVHLIGKDILRHHAVYWPILLKALNLPLPKMIFAHGWWVQSGEKMSKSRGNVVDPVEIVKTYGVDAFRYFLLREVPFGQDGTFSEEALILRYNTDLANDLGNLLHRSLTMCEKYFMGEIPKINPVNDFFKGLSLEDAQKDHAIKENPIVYASLILAVQTCCDRPRRLQQYMEKLAFSDALADIWLLVNDANTYIEKMAPWKLAKEDKRRELGLVIYSLCECLRYIAQFVRPFIPATGQAIWKQLGLAGSPDKAEFREGVWGQFERGGKVAKGAPLFPRIETQKNKGVC